MATATSRITFATVPARASLHEVKSTPWDTSTATAPRDHHQRAAPARSTPVTTTSAAATSQASPIGQLIGFLQLGHRRPAEPLRGAKQVDESMPHDNDGNNPARNWTHARLSFAGFERPAGILAGSVVRSEVPAIFERADTGGIVLS